MVVMLETPDAIEHAEEIAPPEVPTLADGGVKCQLFPPPTGFS